MTASGLRDGVATAAARLGTATLHEAAGRVGALPSRIRPIAHGSEAVAVAGPAYTVLCPPGDNLLLHHAVLAANVGDVLVVDTGGGLEFGYWGEVLAVAAQRRALAGLVIDGGVRDVAALRASGFPVFASNVCIRGTTKDPGLPGALGVPLLMGGVVVQPGDLVVADADGVLALPAADVVAAVRAGGSRVEEEARHLADLRAGASTVEIYGLPAVAVPSRPTPTPDRS